MQKSRSSNNLAPSISSEEWNRITDYRQQSMIIHILLFCLTAGIGNLLYVDYMNNRYKPRSAIHNALYGLRLMEYYFGFEGDYARNVKKRGISLLGILFSYIFLEAIIIGAFYLDGMITEEVKEIMFMVVPATLIPLVLILLFRMSSLRRIKRYGIFNVKQYEHSLKKICQQMNVNYYSTGLDNHSDSGIIGLSANRQYKFASLIFSYNQISEYFNQTYFSKEYEALPRQINL